MGKIPEKAKRVFAGVIFDVYQWEQEMFDGSRMTFEMLKRPNTVEVIPVVGDKILIQEQEQPGSAPFLSLPGGRVDKNEDSLAAVKREFLEETGYVSENWELWDTVDPYGKMEWTIYSFIARDCRRQQEMHLDIGEKITLKFVSFDEFLALADNPNFYEPQLVPKLLQMRLDPAKLETFRKKLFPR